tara:strand:+ start:45 stop:737 length:693 start_codon:yes stop_codon:yes gene_type:complete
MNDNILDNSLVNMVLAHNVGGPTGFDAISNDPVINFEKHATGFTGMLYNMVSKDMTETFKLNFPATFSDTLEYANSNDVIKEVSCPRIFGWKFSNNQKESGILTNITDSTYSISVENAYSSDLLWTHWTAADTLRAYISGYDSIERNYQIGKTNISIPPFSLNTCITVIEGDINQDDILNVLDIVMIVNFIINENTISNKQFAISDLNLDEIINVLDIVVLVSLILANGS